MVTCGDTGLPVLACRAVYGSSLSLSAEELPLRLSTRGLAAAAAAADDRP